MGQGGGFKVFLFLLVVAGLAYVWYQYDQGEIKLPAFDLTTETRDRIELVRPAVEVGWCRIQNINPGEDLEDPELITIDGWDPIEECCHKTVTGFNCALNRDSSLSYCYTGDVGGVVRYAKIDGYNIDSLFLSEFINDYNKEEIEGITCDDTKYPGTVR